ncbi:MAG: hypothetical protein ACRDLS_16985 [Solirubrobacteraceae bacterium]
MLWITMVASLISLLFIAIPVAVFAASIRYASHREGDSPSEVHKRFSPGLWLGQGRG